MYDSCELRWGPEPYTPARRDRTAKRLALEAAKAHTLRRDDDESDETYEWRRRQRDRHLGRLDRRLPQASEPEPRCDPVPIDLDGIHARFTEGRGELTAKTYPRGAWRAGKWKIPGTPVTLMCSEPGTVRLRAELPKLVFEYNDRLLDERSAHEALRKLVEIGSEAVGVPLNLREATLARLDYCYQWEVDSVAEQINLLMNSHTAPRRKLELHISPAGGRTLYFGKGTKHLQRFYDKGAQARENRDDVVYEIDRLLRFEIQDWRSKSVALTHEDGYRANDARERLQRVLDPLAALAVTDLSGYLAPGGDLPDNAITRLGLLYAGKNPHVWPILRQQLSSSAYYKHRARARGAAAAVHPWRPIVPEDAFSGDIDSRSLWFDDSWEIAA